MQQLRAPQNYTIKQLCLSNIKPMSISGLFLSAPYQPPVFLQIFHINNWDIRPKASINHCWMQEKISLCISTCFLIPIKLIFALPYVPSSFAQLIVGKKLFKYARDGIGAALILSFCVQYNENKSRRKIDVSFLQNTGCVKIG